MYLFDFHLPLFFKAQVEIIFQVVIKLHNFSANQNLKDPMHA